MKKVLAYFLTLAMVLAMVPVARATGDGLTEQPVSKVYVSNAGDDGNSGESPEAPVKTLQAAINKLNGADGAVVVMDTIDHSEADLTGAGHVTFTGEGYEANSPTIRFTKGGHFHFTPRATVEHLRLLVSGAGNVRLYGSDELTVGENVITAKEDGSKTLFVCGGYYKKACDSSELTVLSGDFDRIYACNDYRKISSAKLVVGGTASANELIAGGNRYTDKKGNVFKTEDGSIEITIRGGTYGPLTLPALADGKVNGSIAVTLEGGSLGGFKKNSTATGALNVVLKGGELQSAGDFGDFTSTALTLDGFNGQIPSGLLAKFDTVELTNNCDATYQSSDLTSQTITVNAGSTLTLAGYTEKPSTVTWLGEGTVALAEPVYTETEPVLLLTFEEENAADVSGLENNGTVHGSPAFGAGYDGGTAIYLQNEFGTRAQQYVTFWNLKGVDISRNDFSVVFWYKTVHGGSEAWATAANQADMGAGLDFSTAKRGGVIFSNKDNASPTAPGISMANMPQKAYIISGVTDTAGKRYEKVGIEPPQDERWHQVTAVYDRSGAYTVYVDGVEEASINISAAKGQVLGSNFLTLGADLSGQYGLGNAYVDDFAVYPTALSYTDVRGSYRLGALKALIYEVEERLETAGPLYDGADIQTMAEKNAEMKALAETLTIEDGARADAARAELKAAFDDFLLSIAGKANQTMLLLSDVHIGAANDARSAALRTIFADLTELHSKKGLKLDGVVNAGDFADNATAAAGNAAFDVMNEVLEAYGKDAQMLVSLGNHEVNYIDEDECFKTGAYTYAARLQDHIDREGRTYGSGVLDDAKNFCFGMTLGDYHYLVLNTDEQEQTGDAKAAVSAGQDGNAVDPIRHGVIFEDDTLAWIDAMLARYSEDGKPIFVVCHFPFIDSVPLSYYREQRVEDNSIGTQDKILREMFAKYDNLIYFCGHLHSSVAMSGPVAVTTEAGASFTEVNLPSLKVNVRGYTGIPATWIMFVYDTEIVLRARDFGTGEWLTAYDAVIPLTSRPADPPSTGSAGSTVKTETVTNGDGSKTVTKTDRATGAVTMTTTYPGGAVVKTDISAAGEYETRVTVPAGARAEVLIPTEVRGTAAVAVLVLPDGTQRVLPDSVPAEGGVRATVPQSGTVKVVTVSSSYGDVPGGTWFTDAAAFVSARGILRGTGKDTFAPDAKVTRATLMTALARLAGEDTSGGETWWQIGLEWSKDQGISDGADPDGLITREQLAAMLWRYAGAPESGGSLSAFSDGGDVSPWAAEAMAWAVEKGILNGRSGLLAPAGTATRAETAAVLMRFLLAR